MAIISLAVLYTLSVHSPLLKLGQVQASQAEETTAWQCTRWSWS
jgi:hypothetical protein